MLKILCSICRKELKEPGALILEPPKYYDSDKPKDVGKFKRQVVGKCHVCVKCFTKYILPEIV